MTETVPLIVIHRSETRTSKMISGKLVLVTGASSGIGAAAAKAMAKEGARVVLLARSEKALDQVAAEIASTGGTVWTYRVDLTDPKAITTVGTQISHQLGTPDILINSAGVGKWRFTDETTPSEAVECMTVPYFAAFNIVHAFLPAMLRRRKRSHREYEFRGFQVRVAGCNGLFSRPLGGSRVHRSVARRS